MPGKSCAFLCLRSFGETERILLILDWRPRRDLNPCYRRESASERILTTSTNTLSAPQLSAIMVCHIVPLMQRDRVTSAEG